MQSQQLGRIRVSKVLEMEDGLPLSLVLPDVTTDELERVLRWYADPDLTPDPQDSRLMLSMHSFVIQIDGYNILVDACNGNHKRRSVPSVHRLDTPYLANLAALGLRPEDIHVVMCTHLHFDHVGWNTRLENGRWVPTFPNARYVFSAQDYAHWSVQEEEGVHREAFNDSVLPVVEASQAHILDIDGDTPVHCEVGEGVWLEPAFGHSPGSCIINAQAGGAPAVFWGDVIHHPLQLIRPELGLIDFDPAAAMQVRRGLLDRVADSDTMCFSAHFRSSSAGHVRRDGEAYRFDFVAG